MANSRPTVCSIRVGTVGKTLNDDRLGCSAAHTATKIVLITVCSPYRTNNYTFGPIGPGGPSLPFELAVPCNIIKIGM